MSMAYTVAQLLAVAGIGAFNSQAAGDWSINVGVEPANPNKTITLYDTGGDGPDTDEMDVDRKTIQVRVRAHSRADASAKIHEVRAYLLTREEKISGSKRLFGAFVTSDAAEIGRDDNGRSIFTVNFRTLSNEV